MKYLIYRVYWGANLQNYDEYTDCNIARQEVENLRKNGKLATLTAIPR